MTGHTSISRTARRSPVNEAGLVWVISGAVVCLTIYYFSITTDAVPNPFGMNVPGNAITLGVIAGAIFAAIYYVRVRDPILRARRDHAHHLHTAQATREAEIQRQIATMKAGEGTP